MANNIPAQAVMVRPSYGNDEANVGLGTLVLPRKRRDGTDTAHIEANVRGSAHLGNGVQAMASAGIPVDAEKAANLQSVKHLIDPAKGHASVGLRQGGNTLLYTRGKDSHAVDGRVQLDNTGLGLGYNRSANGGWQARGNLNAVLEGMGEAGIGAGIDSEGTTRLSANFHSGDFNIGGDTTQRKDGNKSYNARVGYNYKF